MLARGDREELDPHRFGKPGLLDLLPQLVEIEQALGDEECGNHLLERGAFLLGHVESDARAEAVDEPVCDLGGDDLVAQAVGADRVRMGLAHRLRERREQLRLHQRIVGKLQLLGRVLEDQLGDRQNDGELGPGQAAVLLDAPQQLLARLQALDLAVEPSRGFEQLDRPNVRGKRRRPARLGDRQGERLQAIVLEDDLGDVIRHPREQAVALVER